VSSTTTENAILQYIDIITLLLVLIVLFGLFYFAFGVLKISVPPSVQNIFNAVGVKISKLGEIPEKANNLFNII
jgi:hypothetical protein